MEYCQVDLIFDIKAENIYKNLNGESKVEIKAYEEAVKKSWIYDELKETRNVKGGFKYGKYFGLMNR